MLNCIDVEVLARTLSTSLMATSTLVLDVFKRTGERAACYIKKKSSLTTPKTQTNTLRCKNKGETPLRGEMLIKIEDCGTHN
jgi:hypothetical protein